MLQIRRSRKTNVDLKQQLRAHIDRLPVAQQREFVALAFQLVTARRDGPDLANPFGPYKSGEKQRVAIRSAVRLPS